MYEEYVTKKKRQSHTRKRRKNTNLPLSQADFEQLVVDSIIDGMWPISIVSLDAFKQYTNGNLNYIINFDGMV